MVYKENLRKYIFFGEQKTIKVFSKLTLTNREYLGPQCSEIAWSLYGLFELNDFSAMNIYFLIIIINNTFFL